ESDAGLADRRPALVLGDAVAVDEERRDRFQAVRLLRVALTRRLDRDQRADLFGARLRDLKAELAGLRVKQDHARADAIDERRIRSDDGVVGRGPAWHHLAHEVVVALG